MSDRTGRAHVIGADNPSKNVKEFVDWMKQHPDKANYASSSPAFTITTELLKLKTGMPGVAIPYKSSNEMILSVIQGQSAMTIADGPPTVPQVKAGKVKALAVTGKDRSEELPDTPTMAEAGYRASTFSSEAASSRRPAAPGLFSITKVWPRMAGGVAAGDRRETAESFRRGDPRSGRGGEASGHGRQSGRPAARRVPKDHRQRHHQIPRGRQSRQSQIRGIAACVAPAGN